MLTGEFDPRERIIARSITLTNSTCQPQRLRQSLLSLRPRARHDHPGQPALLQRPRRVPELRRRGVGSRGDGKAVILQNHGLLTVRL
jgi:hypothetical protein